MNKYLTMIGWKTKKGWDAEEVKVDVTVLSIIILVVIFALLTKGV